MGEMNISRAHIPSLQLACNTTLSTCSSAGAACVLIHSGSTKKKMECGRPSQSWKRVWCQQEWLSGGWLHSWMPHFDPKNFNQWIKIEFTSWFMNVAWPTTTFNSSIHPMLYTMILSGKSTYRVGCSCYYYWGTGIQWLSKFGLRLLQACRGWATRQECKQRVSWRGKASE